MTTIITEIDRNNFTQLSKNITTQSCSGYFIAEISNWTPQMFYELPALKLDIYTDQGGTSCKYKMFEYLIKTYDDKYLLQNTIKISTYVKNIPTSCTIVITPIFDNNAVQARNALIENGIEVGSIWDNKIQIFPITISFEEV